MCDPTTFFSIFILTLRPPPGSTLFPYTTLFRSQGKFDRKAGSLVLFAFKLDRTFEKNRSEEHTSELQSQSNIVCRLLLVKNKNKRCPSISNIYLEEKEIKTM